MGKIGGWEDIGMEVEAGEPDNEFDPLEEIAEAEEREIEFEGNDL